MADNQFYSYDGSTGEYLGIVYGQSNPISSGYLQPRNSTSIAPPGTAAQTVAVWNGTNWTTLADHRGETWYQADGTAVIISVIGDPASDGLLSTQPTVSTPSPQTITPLQFRLQLVSDGLWDAAKAEFNNISADYIFELPWATQISKADTQIQSILSNIGVVSIDAFFTSASSIIRK